MKEKKTLNKVVASTMLFLPLSTLSSCGYHVDQFLYHDAELRLHEYEIAAKIRNTDGKKIQASKKAGIKVMQASDAIYAPEEPKAIEDKIVSINVTEEVPIVDLIMELARMSGTDVQIDPTITGGVNLNVKDKPLRYVFNRICGLSDTRYKEKNGILIFEKDVPFAKTYELNFLDMTRSTSSSISLNTSGLSESSSGGGSSSISTSSNDTFWDDVVNDIKQIIESSDERSKLYTEKAEEIQDEIRIAEEKKNALDDGKSENKEDKKKDKKNDKDVSGSIRLNKRAGLITITADEKAHRLIEKYLAEVRRKATAQVLIEMRFLEINLSKTYEAGIDWSKVSLLGAAGNAATTGLSTLTNPSIGSIVFSKGINATANLFEQFGSTRTLSNPRINAFNNQPAVMSFTTNHVYFKIESEVTQPTTSSSGAVVPGYRNIKAESQTMPLGVIMSVLPSIDLDKREIVLNMRPTISKLEKTVQDPSTTMLLNYDENGNKIDTSDSSQLDKTDATNQNNPIPVANLREFDTILKLKDGQTAVIGGFTERKKTTVENGVPFLRALPLIGNLFAHKTDEVSSVETVILVRATIVDNGGKEMTEYERGIYDTFSDDPRLGETYSDAR